MADDGFEAYYTEKLWEMIPAIYRHEDGLGENPGVLRSLVEVMAAQAAILRRSHDRLWEDQFIELCDDWAVPYLGDLVGTRLVSALNRRGRRVDVAKTLYYRRRKGTLAVLEQLISDITGWEGTVTEQFRRLGRARHRLDPLPAPLAGRFTGTPPGGWADLRKPRGAELAHGPFDEYHHTPDMRRHRGVEGRYNIPKIAFYLYRLSAYEVRGVTPCLVDAENGRYTFDPSGRDIPLFMPASRPQDPRTPDDSGHWDRWRPAREWELPAPMHCRVLGHAEYAIDQALTGELAEEGVITATQADELNRLRGRRFPDEPALRRALKVLPSGVDFLADGIFVPLAGGALIPDGGKAHLLFRALKVEAMEEGEGGEETGGNLLPRVADPAGELTGQQKVQRSRARTTAANLRDWMPSDTEGLVIDPERGRFIPPADPASADSLSVTYHYGLSGPIGAGPYPRGEGRNDEAEETEIIEFSDSATRRSVENRTIDSSTGTHKLVLRATDRQRPYFRLADREGSGTDWVFNGVHGDGDSEPVLVLDGLWIGSQRPGALVLQGDFERVDLHHVTLDPGGTDAGGETLPALTLNGEAGIDRLRIESSITGPIQVADTVEQLVIRDAIVQSITAPDTDVILERVTVFGRLEARRLWATEALLIGNAQAADIQAGCFRFGAALSGSRLPKPYESHWLDDTGHLFVSRRFGDPGYAQLSEAAPDTLRRGAENGSEIGAFSGLLNPIKMDSLQAKVDEFLPFGLIPVYLPET